MRYLFELISTLVWLCAATVVGMPLQVDSKAEADNTSTTSEAGEIGTPEIVALAWMKSGESNDISFWRPNGKNLPDAIGQELISELGIHHFVSKASMESPPLLIIFDVGTQLLPTSGVEVTCEFPEGQSIRTGYTTGRKPGSKYAISSIDISDGRRTITWPDSVNLNLKFPVDDPVLIKKINVVPKEPILLARGISWFVKQDAGYVPGTNGPRYPAAVLKQSNDSLDLLRFIVRVYKKGSESALRDTHTSTTKENNGEHFSLFVSDRFPDADELDRV